MYAGKPSVSNSTPSSTTTMNTGCSVIDVDAKLYNNNEAPLSPPLFMGDFSRTANRNKLGDDNKRYLALELNGGLTIFPFHLWQIILNFSLYR
jgi:hypothetical protein